MSSTLAGLQFSYPFLENLKAAASGSPSNQANRGASLGFYLR